MKNVFVAGHRGMVGSSLIRHTPDAYRTFTVDKSFLDLEDVSAVKNYLVENRIDTVVLAAALVGGIEANSKHQMNFLLRNLRIQNSVIEASTYANVKNFAFLGSSCVYPKLASQPIREESLLTGPLEPTNEGYAIAKIAGIRLCQAIYEELGLNYFSLMPSNLYGPNDNFSLETSHVPAALMRRFHEAKVGKLEEVVVWGTGNPRREFLHVDDLAQATWHLLEKNMGGQLINVGTGVDIPIGEFARLIANTVGYEGQIVFDESKPDGTPQKLLNVSKIHGFGWHHRIELEAGLKQTYEWFSKSLGKGEVRGM